MAKTITRRVDTIPDRGGSLVASSVDVSKLLTKSSWDMPGRQKAWQREIYRLLEIVGELRSAAKLIGTAVSQARLYIADLDEDGEIRGETENVKAQRICKRILGGGKRREDEMRLLGMNLFLVGEAFLWGRTAPDVKERDAWHTLSINSFQRTAGKLQTDLGAGKVEILEGDILRRVFMPHPERREQADAPTRSTRVILQELEQLTKFVLTQIDSRLLSAGILPWPNGTMTTGTESTVGSSIMKQIMDLASAANDGTGTSAAAMPLIVDVPPEALGKIQLVNFQSDLSRIAGELRTEAVKRLAMGFDIAPEQLLGSGDTNHWSVWYIDESAVKVHVEPILQASVEAIESAWVAPALKASGLDPERYTLAYDVSTLTVRPQRLKDTLDLYMQGLVSARAVLEAGAYRTGDAPDKIEESRRFLRELALRYPQLLDQPEMRDAMGLGEDIIKPAPPAPELPATAPPPPAPDVVPGKHQLPVMPNTQSTPTKQQGVAGVRSTVTASAAPVTLALADACARRTFELAGGRLLNRANRNQHQDVPRGELHTRIWVDPDKLRTLTAGADETAVALASQWCVEDPERFAASVRVYCDTMLTRGARHDVDTLATALKLGGYDAL